MRTWHHTVRRGLAVTVGVVVTVGVAVTATPARAQPFTLTVARDQLFGASEGVLRFEADAVVYETTDGDDRGAWAYDNLQQIQVLSPTRLRVKTYDDHGWLKLGADRTFEFDVRDGVVPPALVAFLWDRLRMPMVTAVAPAPSAAVPALAVPVKLRRWPRGSQGVLELSDAGLVYATGEADHARAWRPRDLRMVYQPDRHRLTVDAYEGGGGRTRAFSFDLKQPLPPGFLDRVWQWLHAPSTMAGHGGPRLDGDTKAVEPTSSGECCRRRSSPPAS